jgi:hypothetical protein
MFICLYACRRIKTYKELLSFMRVNADSYVPLRPHCITRTRKSQGTSQNLDETHIKLHIPSQISTRIIISSYIIINLDEIRHLYISNLDEISYNHKEIIYIIMNLDVSCLHLVGHSCYNNQVFTDALCTTITISTSLTRVSMVI